MKYFIGADLGTSSVKLILLSDEGKTVDSIVKYYSVSYDNWFDDIVTKYTKINAQIGNLQDYKITFHQVLIGERVIDSAEKVSNLQALMDEFAAQLGEELLRATDNKVAELNGSKDIGVAIDVDALMACAYEQFGYELDGSDVPAEYAEMFDAFETQLAGVLTKFATDYRYQIVADTNNVASGVNLVLVDAVSYDSQYNYVTNSTAYDNDYVKTDYTVDNDLIVMVTYANNEGKMKTFIINYNIYAVEVTIDLGFGLQTYQIGKYDFEPINH